MTTNTLPSCPRCGQSVPQLLALKSFGDLSEVQTCGRCALARIDEYTLRVTIPPSLWPVDETIPRSWAQAEDDAANREMFLSDAESYLGDASCPGCGQEGTGTLMPDDVSAICESCATRWTVYDADRIWVGDQDT